MKLIEKEIEQQFNLTIKKLFPEMELKAVQIQSTANEKFGDYQTNFAMMNSKILKSNPRAIAENIKENLDYGDVIEKVEIAGPGFINIFLKDSYLSKKVLEIGKEKYDFSFIDTHGDVVIDYSSPNIAKRMHIGHLRSTVIGDSIKRIYQFMGYNTVADNHIGDWGTQFGKLIVAYDRWLDKSAYEENAIEELERIYVEFSKQVENNSELEELAREELKKLQNGDERNNELWKEFIKVSMDEYENIYGRMDVHFDTYYGESFYNDSMLNVISELQEKEIAKEDQGAQVVFFDEETNLYPCIVQKKDGAYLYATSDLATIKFRRKTYDLNKIIYVTDERQQDHFKQIFEISKMMNWNDEKIHVWFGIMRFADGIFSSRKGNVIKLNDLLNEAQKRAYDIVNEKNPELSEEEKQNISEIVGIGAVKYADLSQNRQSAIIFEWDKILSFEGNTAPYLQYSYARIKSIIRKAKAEGIEIKEADVILNEAQEKTLAKALFDFPKAVLNAANTCKPNLVTDYLFETSKKFNSFYNAVPVLKAESNEIVNSRLVLALKTAKVIQDGLDLLGIKTVERM